MVDKNVRGDKVEEEVPLAEENDSEPAPYIQIPFVVSN